MIHYLQNSDLRQIVENTSWMIFDKVFLLFLNLLVTVKVANYFGASEYGLYQYAINVVAIFEILVTFVDSRVIKKQYQLFEPEKVVYIATIIRIFFSCISAVLGILFLFVYSADTTFTLVFSILLLDAIVKNLRFGMVNRFEYLLHAKRIVIASDLTAVVSSLLQLGAIYLKYSIVSISVIALISTFVNLILIYFQYKLHFKEPLIQKLNLSFLGVVIKESAPFAIAASCATIYSKCDSVMIGSMLSTADVGIYAIAAKLVSIVQIAIVPIQDSVFPKLISLHGTNPKKYEQYYIRITSFLTWIYIGGVIVSLVILPFVLSFFNPEYEEAFPVYKVLVLGTFFIYNAALRAGHLTLINKGDILMYSQMLSVIANILMNIIGIKLFGMYGAALATVITQGVSLMFSNLFFKEEGKKIFYWQIKGLNPFYIFKPIKF